MPPAIPTIQTMLSEAVAIPSPDERRAYLDSVCGADPALRARVEQLIANHFRAGSFLEPLTGVAALSGPTAAYQPEAGVSAIGTRIGPYTLREQIGEGGMGLVFVAEQTEPFRRRVALKLIKPGMDTRQVVARFEAERQALALMDHPNIARVLDAGATAEGRPFFVMELVKGEPITAYCDRQRLPMRARLDLFLQVCGAVQHAHQKGVIHRDLKPSNVLVVVHDVTPAAKVIDFGIAKAVGRSLTDNTVYTGFSQLIGTPLYMSPEQAGQSGLDIDTRTDVYALGVLLYELLTGTTPFDGETFRTAGYDEIRRIIREEEPPRPSARLSTLKAAEQNTVAECRGADARKLGQQVRGELDWVVMKCLEKDRNRRYESAGALAADVRRYLADEPIEARPPSVGYRLGKFARRHKGPVLAAAAVLMAAAIGVGWVWYEKGQTEAALVLARENETRANNNAGSANAQRRRAEGRLKDMLVLVDAQIDQMSAAMKTPNPPTNLTDKMAKQSREIIAVLEKMDADYVDDEGHRRRLGRVSALLGGILCRQEQFAEAIPCYQRAESVYANLVVDFPADCQILEALSETCMWLGHSLRATGQLRPAEAAYRRCAVAYQRVVEDFPKDPFYAGHCLILPQFREPLGRLLRSEGRFKEAEGIFRQALADCQRHIKVEPKEFREAIHEQQRGLAATYRSYVGQCLAARGLFAEADAEYRAALKDAERNEAAVWDIYAPAKLEVASFRAHCPEKRFQHLAEAMQLVQEVVRKCGESTEPRVRLAMIQYRGGDYPAAKATLDETTTLLQKRGGDGFDDPFEKAGFNGRYYLTLALVTWQSGNREKAQQVYRMAVKWLERCHPAEVDLLSLRDEAAALIGILEDGRSQKPQ